MSLRSDPPTCPVCGERVTTWTMRLGEPPSVGPCGHSLSPDEVRELERIFTALRMEKVGEPIPRTIRVPDLLWDDTKATAKRRDETVSEAVRMFLETYTDGTEGAIRRLARWLRGGDGR